MDPIDERNADGSPFTPEQSAKAHGAKVVTLVKFIEEVGPQNGVDRQQIIKSAKLALKDKTELPIIVGEQYYFIPYASIFDFFNPPSPAVPVIQAASSPPFPVKEEPVEDPFPAEDGAVDPMIPTGEPRKPGRPKKS